MLGHKPSPLKHRSCFTENLGARSFPYVASQYAVQFPLHFRIQIGGKIRRQLSRKFVSELGLNLKDSFEQHTQDCDTIDAQHIKEGASIFCS